MSAITPGRVVATLAILAALWTGYSFGWVAANEEIARNQGQVNGVVVATLDHTGGVGIVVRGPAAAVARIEEALSEHAQRWMAP